MGSIDDLKKSASPMPWRIDKMNATGIDIVDAVGNPVYIEDYAFPDEMRGSMVDDIITQSRSNAMLIVLWSGGSV